MEKMIETWKQTRGLHMCTIRSKKCEFDEWHNSSAPASDVTMFVLESFEQTLFSNVDFKKLTNQHFAWCCRNCFFKIWTFSKTYPGFCCLEKSKHLPVFTPPSACCPRHLFPILFCWKLFQIFTHKPLSILHSDQTSHRKVPSAKWERKGYLSEMKTNKDVFIKPMCCVCSYSFETSCIPFGWYRQLCDPRFLYHTNISPPHTQLGVIGNRFGYSLNFQFVGFNTKTR